MYAELEDFKNRLGTSFSGLYGPGGDDTALRDLNAAESEVNAVLSLRYAIPVTGAPDFLRNCVLTLAEELAYARGAGSDYAEKVKSRVANIRSLLSQAAQGKILLVSNDNAAAPEQKAVTVSVVQCDKPQLNRDTLKGY